MSDPPFQEWYSMLMKSFFCDPYQWTVFEKPLLKQLVLFVFYFYFFQSVESPFTCKVYFFYLA